MMGFEGYSDPPPTARQRYEVRLARFSTPSEHHFWWLMHNAVAHPLIALFPRETFFAFHDYTSHRLNWPRKGRLK